MKENRLSSLSKEAQRRPGQKEAAAGQKEKIRVGSQAQVKEGAALLPEALRIEPSAIRSRGLQIEISGHVAFVIKVGDESTHLSFGIGISYVHTGKVRDMTFPSQFRNRNQSCPCRKGQRYVEEKNEMNHFQWSN